MHLTLLQEHLWPFCRQCVSLCEQVRVKVRSGRYVYSVFDQAPTGWTHLGHGRNSPFLQSIFFSICNLSPVSIGGIHSEHVVSSYSRLWNASSLREREREQGWKDRTRETRRFACAGRVCVWSEGELKCKPHLVFEFVAVECKWFIMWTREELYLGISQKVSSWAAGHNFRQVICL